MQTESRNAEKSEASYLNQTTKTIRMEKIYLTAGMFTLIGFAQMAFIRVVIFDLGDRTPMPGFMWLVISLICLFLLVYSELFNKFPINWTLGSVAVESMTMCVVCYDWTYLNMFHAAIIVLSVLVVNAFLHLLGAFLPVACLPGYRFMLITTIIYIILYILLTIVVRAIQIKQFLVITDSCSLLYTIALTFYGSTIIHHRRTQDNLSDEYVLSATIIATFLFLMINLVTSIFNCAVALYKTHALK